MIGAQPLMQALTVVALMISFLGGLQETRTASLDAKSTAAKSIKPFSEAPSTIEALPFKIGEVLTYEATFSKFIFSGTIGELTLSVLLPSDPSKSKLLELRADAASKGFFPALIGLKVKDRFSAFINPRDFGLEYSARNIEENKVKRTHQSTIVRDSGKVRVVDSDLTKDNVSTTTKEAPSPCWTQDVLSALYYARFQPLREGDTIPVPISDLGSNYNIELAVLQREEVKVTAGKFKAIQIDIRAFNGRYVKRSGELMIWLSDDNRRIPILARLKTSGYTATIELKKIASGERAN